MDYELETDLAADDNTIEIRVYIKVCNADEADWTGATDNSTLALTHFLANDTSLDASFPGIGTMDSAYANLAKTGEATVPVMNAVTLAVMNRNL